MPRTARKATTTELYRDFEKAEAAYKAIPDSEQKRWERALDKACKLARQVVRSRANTIEEMLLKIRVAVWDVGNMKYERLEDLDRWKPGRFSKGAEYDALDTLRDDLRHL